MDFKIVNALTPEQIQEWDHFVEEAPHSHIFQTYPWGQFQKIYSGREVLYFSGAENGKTKVLGQIFKKQWPRVPLFNYEMPFGPVFHDAVDYAAALKYLDGALKGSAVTLDIGPRWPIEYYERFSEICRERGFKPRRDPREEGYPNETVWVDLRRPLAEILAGFRYTTRYEIRRAERNGIEVSMGTDAAMLEQFYGFYQGQMAHRQWPPTEKRFFDSLLSHFLSDSRRGIIAVARHGEQVLSAAIFYRLGPMVWYTFGASDMSQKKNQDTTHLLHWKVMEYFKGQGCAWYDFSGAYPKLPLDDPGYGVNVFKTGFSKHFVRFTPRFAKDYRPSLVRLMKMRRRVNDLRLFVSGKVYAYSRRLRPF